MAREPQKSVKVFGLRVFDDDLASVPVERPCATVTTISPKSYGIATGDPAFWAALKDADYLVLDGVYFALASMMLKGKSIRPNQGWDVFVHFLARLDAMRGRVFFLGASRETLAKISARMARGERGKEMKRRSEA